MKAIPRLLISVCSALTGGMVAGVGSEIGSNIARGWSPQPEAVIGSGPTGNATALVWCAVGFIVVFAVVYERLGR